VETTLKQLEISLRTGSRILQLRRTWPQSASQLFVKLFIAAGALTECTFPAPL